MILVDTAAFYALLDRADPAHPAAVAAFEQLRAADAALVAHQYVLVETTALLQRRLGMAAVRRFTDDLLPLVEVVWIDAELHAEAREALLAADRRDISLVDRILPRDAQARHRPGLHLRRRLLCRRLRGAARALRP